MNTDSKKRVGIIVNPFLIYKATESENKVRGMVGNGPLSIDLII